MIYLRHIMAIGLLVVLANVGCDSPPNTTAIAATDMPGTEKPGTDKVGKQANTQVDSKPVKATVEATFDKLKFEMEKTERFEREMLTPEIEDLLDQSIRIRGYIYPTNKKRGIKQFVLVRDNLECCFGPGAALYDCILVKMEPGKTAEFSIRPVAVEGTLRLDEVIGHDGKQLVIYQMDGRSVR